MSAKYKDVAPKCALIVSDIRAHHAARAARVVERQVVDLHVIEVFARANPDGMQQADAQYLRGSPLTRLQLHVQMTYRAIRKPIHDALTRLAPNVVITPGWSMPDSLLAIEWCIARGVPIVMMSDSTRDAAPRNPMKEIVKRYILRLAQAAFVAGGPQADYIIELGMPPSRVFLGYDVVDNAHFARNADLARHQGDPLRAELNLPENYFFVCARLVSEKNLERLIEAFARYRQRIRAAPWSMIIAGPGPQQDVLEARIEAHGMSDCARLIGPLGYDALPQYYALAGAKILASVSETWGLAVNEAMAAGLPVLISNRCGCAPDLVRDGRNGFTFDPLDIDAMADAMVNVSSTACNRAAMGRASREIIADWGLDRFAAGLEAAASAVKARPLRRPSFAGQAFLRVVAAR